MSVTAELLISTTQWLVVLPGRQLAAGFCMLAEQIVAKCAKCGFGSSGHLDAE